MRREVRRQSHISASLRLKSCDDDDDDDGNDDYNHRYHYILFNGEGLVKRVIRQYININFLLATCNV